MRQGSRSLTIGASGCNFRCRYCSKANIALQDPEVLAHIYTMTPEELVGMARKLNCHSLIFNGNDCELDDIAEYLADIDPEIPWHILLQGIPNMHPYPGDVEIESDRRVPDTGADICIECFACNLYNQGCLGVIHRFK
jgi:pyruvate-formate lyase-activating enzyme